MFIGVMNDIVAGVLTTGLIFVIKSIPNINTDSLILGVILFFSLRNWIKDVT